MNWLFVMSKSVVYYSHTYYDVNGSYDAIKYDIWVSKRSVVMARNLTLQRTI